MFERARHKVGAMLDRLRSHWKVTAIVTTAAIYVVGQFFGKWITDTAAPALWARLVKWGNAPTGVSGLVLVAVIAIAFIWAAIDPLRLLPKGKAARPKLTERDRLEAERVREMWHGEAEQACESAARLLDDAINWIRDNGVPFVILVRDRATALRESAKKLTVALNASANEPVAEVQSKLGEVVLAYRNAVAWLNFCHAYDVGQPSTLQKVALYGQWQREHAALTNGITALKRRAAFAEFDSGGIEEDPTRILLDGHRWQEYRLRAPGVEPIVRSGSDDDGTTE